MKSLQSRINESLDINEKLNGKKPDNEKLQEIIKKIGRRNVNIDTTMDGIAVIEIYGKDKQAIEKGIEEILDTKFNFSKQTGFTMHPHDENARIGYFDYNTNMVYTDRDCIR